jgi:2-hydroxychromene-2-carboxylate isomerase
LNFDLKYNLNHGIGRICMATVDITLNLPEELVEQAKSAGVLTDERVAALLEAEIKRQTHAQRFQATLRQLRAAEPLLMQKEIDDEIDAHHAENE